MKTNRFLIFCLVLIAIIVMAIPADAQVTGWFGEALFPFVSVEADTSGDTALTGVVNGDDESVTVTLQVFSQEGPGNGTLVFDGDRLIPAYGVATWNFRDIGLRYEEYPNGVFHGWYKVKALERDVLIVGDNFTINSSLNLAEGSLLIQRRGQCIDRCDRYAARYMQGGPFSGGTCVQVFHEGGSFSERNIDVSLRDEAGNPAGSFTIPDTPASSRFCLRDYNVVAPFGWMEIALPTYGAVTVTYEAQGHYSVGMPASCMVPCDHCKVRSACYAPDETCPHNECTNVNLTLVGDQVCRVGESFNAVINRTGSPGNNPVICDTPLPDGVFYNSATRTFSGSCENEEIPQIHCHDENSCSDDEIFIPVVGENPTYGVSVDVDVRPKDCLEPGDTTVDVTLDIRVANTQTGPIVANLTTSLPGCSQSNIALSAGQAVTKTCIHAFPLGETIVTANVTLVGRPETASDSHPVIITECSEVCEGVQPPTVHSFTITGQDFDSVFTRGRLVYTGAGVSGRFVYTPLPEDGFDGGPVTSGQDYDSAYDKLSSDRTVNLNWAVLKGGETCHQGTEQLVIHAQNDCEDYTIPVPQFGTPQVTPSATSIMVNNIPVMNGLVCDWDPNLPSGPHARPPFGQPATSVPFHCDATYTPPNTTLSCPTEGDISVSIPPQDASCPAQPIIVPLTANVTENTTNVVVNFVTATPPLNGAVTVPSTPQTITRPGVGQPAITRTYTQTGTTTHQGLQCPASGSVTVTVQPQVDSCTLNPPTLTLGNHTFTENDTSYTVTGISHSTSPTTTGTLTCVPSFPDTVNKPVYGQPAGSRTYTCTFAYTKPSGLACTVQKQKTITIPTQTCPVSNPPSASVLFNDENIGGDWHFVADSEYHNQGPWWTCIYATDTTNNCTSYKFQAEKICVQTNLSCGGNDDDKVIYKWEGHSLEKWRAIVWQGTKPTFVAGQAMNTSTLKAQTNCQSNTHNLTSGFDESLWPTEDYIEPKSN